ncbi:hypothetical protein VPH35_038942 [Triticum aestivum]
MDGMEFFFEESAAGFVPQLDSGVCLRDLVTGEQLTEGGTSGTEDAEEALISSLPMDYEGGEGAGMGGACRMILATKGWAIPAR